MSLGSAELAVRALGLAPGFAAVPFGQYQTSADPELLWEPRPGAEGVNAVGLRGPELEEHGSRPRVLVLGDSIAWGTGLEQPDTISARLQAHLAGHGDGVEVLNAGVSAYTTLQEARRLELLAPVLRLDQVVLLFCVNDVNRLDGIPEGIYRMANEHAADTALSRVQSGGRRSRVWRAAMEHSHLFRLLDEALGARRRVGLAHSGSALELDQIEEGLERVAAAAKAHGFGVTLVTVPMFQRLGPDYPHRRLHEQILARGRALGFDDLDLLPIVIDALTHDPTPLNLPGDLLHPSPAGADLIARVLAERWAERELVRGSR